MIQNRAINPVRTPEIRNIASMPTNLPEIKTSDLMPKKELMRSAVTFKGDVFDLPTSAGEKVTVGKLTFERIPTGIWRVQAEEGVKEVAFETVLADGSVKSGELKLEEGRTFFGFLGPNSVKVRFKERFFWNTMTIEAPVLMKTGKRSHYNLGSIRGLNAGDLYFCPENDEARLFELGAKLNIIGKGVGSESMGGFYNMIGIILDGKVSPSIHGEQFWGQISGKETPFPEAFAGPHGPYFVVFKKDGKEQPVSFDADGHKAYIVPNGRAKEAIVSAVREALDKRIITTERAVDIFSKLKTYAEFADHVESRSTPPPIPSRALSTMSKSATSARLAEQMNVSAKQYLSDLKTMNDRGLQIKGLEVPLSKGAPGGLLKGSTDLKLIYIGDLHGNIGNLDAILAAYGKELDAGTAKLVFLGDLIHPEPHNTASLRDMAPSITAVDAVLKLYSENKAVFLRGDHDNMWKGGVNMPIKNEFVLVKRDKDNRTLVPQVDEFRDQYHREKKSSYLKENKDASDEEAEEHASRCVSELDRFFTNAPLIALIDNVISGHSPAVNEDALMFLPRFMGLEQLLLEAKHNELEFYLTWSRPHTNDAKIPVFGERDLVRMRKDLGRSEKTLFLFGHTKDESAQAAYRNRGMTGAITLMSSYNDKLTVVEVERGEISARDLKGQSPLGGLRASLSNSLRTGSIPR